MTRIERERQVRKQKSILYSCGIAVVAILIVFVLIGISGSSKKVNASIDGKFIYESVMIQSGETLWSIAAKYQDSFNGSLDEYIEEIMSINNMYDDKIHAGDYIIIPVFTKGV